jgi:hypothetical protein
MIDDRCMLKEGGDHGDRASKIGDTPPPAVIPPVRQDLRNTGKRTMNSRAGNATALRRLMTEYKQLTAGGTMHNAELIAIG